jgi:hypothetical protein
VVARQVVCTSSFKRKGIAKIVSDTEQMKNTKTAFVG